MHSRLDTTRQAVHHKAMTDAKKTDVARAQAWGLDLADWLACMSKLGAPAFRAKQIWHGLQTRLISAWDDLSVLPAALRQQLEEHFDIAALNVREMRDSADGVQKMLTVCRDGEMIESVLIPAESRWTLCISSQAGCAFKCAFCASGAAGLSRSLEPGEIVGQVLLASRWLRERAVERPQNIVVMGMGEPMANYDAVLKALKILNAPEGLNIGARHMTISTCGVVPGIQRLADEGIQFELSVSLHAPNDALRSRLMPVNRRWPMQELLAACHDYTAHTGRIVTFEYTLVRNLNDRPEHADELARLLRGEKCRVNLIPLSPVAEFDGETPDIQTCEAFQRTLERARISTTLRRSRGGGVDAACGQLRLHRLRS